MNEATRKYINSPKGKAARKAYKDAHKADNSEYQREYYKQYSDAKVNARLIRNYGITLEDYNAMFEEQKGCCAICGRHQSELDKALSVDHDHETGEVRGLLCYRCNTAIGLFGDDVELAKIAVQYLGG